MITTHNESVEIGKISSIPTRDKCLYDLYILFTLSTCVHPGVPSKSNLSISPYTHNKIELWKSVDNRYHVWNYSIIILK